MLALARLRGFLSFGSLALPAAAGVWWLGANSSAAAAEDKSNGARNHSPLRVCVIGAGMAGASTAYFLRLRYGAQVQVDVFEKSGRVGGRIEAVDLGHGQVWLE